MAKELNKESVFDIAIEMLLIALVFLAPVIFDRRIGIVFSLTKVTTIRLIMIAILSIWSVKIMLKQEHRFIRTPLDYPVLSYFLACTVATLTSVHVLVSFMGFYGRYEGLSTLYIYCLLYFITTNFIKTKDQILRIMYTVIVAGVCMGIYGVIQRMGLDPYAWGGVVTWQRIIGTIGQPNFLAAYVDMAFIIGLALLLNMKKLQWSLDLNNLVDLILRAGLVLSLFIIYVCVLYTQSRGGFVGIFAGLSLFFILANRHKTLEKYRELGVLFGLIFVITIITSLNPATSPFGRAESEATKAGELSTLETPIISYNATLSRFETWKSAYKIIVDRPFFGIGQEVLKMVFPRYETDKFRFYEGFHVKQDRCHNEVCDMGVTRGTITLAIYVWMLATFFYLGVKVIRGDYDPDLKLYTASFLGGSAAYLVQNQFSFGVVAITTLLWVMMGMTASIYVKPEQKPYKEQVDLMNMPWLTFALIVIIAIYLSFLSTIQFRADIYFKDARSLEDVRRFDDAIKQFERSLKISPYEGGTWTHYGISSLNVAQVSQNNDSIKKALDIFSVTYKLDAYNADNFYIAGRAYFILSYSDPSLIPSVILSEKKAISIDPRYAEAYQVLGAMYERNGRNQDAADMYQKAVEINPQIAEAVTGLSNVYLRMGNLNKVIAIYSDFLAKYPNNPIFQENLAAIYVRRGESQKALKIYEDMLVTNPQNVRALVNLGFLSSKMGNSTKARDSFERAIMADPRNTDAHNGLGLYYLQTGQKQRAIEEFNQSLMVDPNNQYAKQMLETIK